MTPRALALLALLAACRSQLLDPGLVGDSGAGDLRRPASTDGGSGGGPGCLPPPDGGTAQCPCGAEGLCRPAGGRLSVQVLTNFGELRLLAMDDNGCRRREVSADLPIGVPRWAADGERLAYLVAGQSRVRLKVIRVAPTGQVACRSELSLGDRRPSELAWGGERTLLLFGEGRLERFDLDAATAQPIELPGVEPARLRHFDARPQGPLVLAVRACDDPTCETRLLLRPDPLRGELQLVTTIVAQRTGQPRLSADGRRLTFEADGLWLVDLPGGQGGAVVPAGARTPAFAWNDQALVFPTEEGGLAIRTLAGPNGALHELPRTWRRAFSPDWTPPPPSCASMGRCP